MERRVAKHEAEEGYHSMSRNGLPNVEIPSLKTCPFCGRKASAMPHCAAPTSPIEWSVGCWKIADPFSRAAHWDDCPEPTTLWISLERAVER